MNILALLFAYVHTGLLDVPTFQVSAQEGYLLEVRIRRYLNPAHTQGVDERCCDASGEEIERSRQPCQSSCDNSFEFCFRPLNYLTFAFLNLNDDSCRLGLFTTGLINSTDPDALEYSSDFVGMIGSAPNPLQVTGNTPWPVS